MIFNEAFFPTPTNQLLNNLESSYPYQTAVLSRSTSGWNRTEGHYLSTTFENGSVAIINEYPIKAKNSTRFPTWMWF